MDANLTETVGVYTVSDDPLRLDIKAMHAYLKRAYWSQEIPLEIVERAARASLCIGAYDSKGAQVGLARFISDFATCVYVCDVYVLEEHHGHGLSKAMMAMASGHPKLQGLRRWTLVTLDAHGLYEQFGFKPIANAERFMERIVPDIYKTQTKR
ncbi:MAG: GNAT family N-acetyltransferase [Gammaproteobacteria bacterium]